LLGLGFYIISVVLENVTRKEGATITTKQGKTKQ